MGYYLRFLEAIPLSRAGYPRVTHRFAAILDKFHRILRINKIRQGSLDLHA